jgi:hypothetical protein
MKTNYYKYTDEYNFAGGTRYIETCEGWSLREVTVADDVLIGSNIKYPKQGLLLSDAQCDYDDIPEALAIDQPEFETVWERHLKNYAGHWAMAKRAYRVGENVTGYLAVFYPQGTIIDYGNGVLGLADYQACKESTEPQHLYTGHIVTGVVHGYDEKQQWLLIASPKVYPETINYPIRF